MRTSVSDLELVHAAQGGQDHAFAILVERTQGLARAIAFSASGDYETAEELAQEALLTAWLRLADLKEPSKFRPWLVGIVRNAARYARRQQSRHAPPASEGLDHIVNIATSDASPLDETLRWEEQRQASEALRSIAKRYREALVLYYTLDESYPQVAAALDISESAARQRLCRARKKLRGHLVPLRASGQRLASAASAGAAIMMLIRSRQSFAAQLTPVVIVAPKFKANLIGLGALTGAAFVASLVVGVILLTGGDEASASIAQGDDLHFSRQEANDDQTTPRHVNESTLQTGSRAPSGSVRIGSGKVQKSVHGVSPPATQLNRQPASLPSRRSRGHIRKHGPAILDRDADLEAMRPLLRPSLSPRELERARWSRE